MIMTSPAPATDAPRPIPTMAPVLSRLGLCGQSLPSLPPPGPFENLAAAAAAAAAAPLLPVGALVSARALKATLGRCVEEREALSTGVVELAEGAVRIVGELAGVDDVVEGGLIDKVGMLLLLLVVCGLGVGVSEDDVNDDEDVVDDVVGEVEDEHDEGFFVEELVVVGEVDVVEDVVLIDDELEAEGVKEGNDPGLSSGL